MSYLAVLKEKLREKTYQGIQVELEELNANLFPFQRRIVRWALCRGRAAIFADCGLGKTLQQLEWARVITERTRKAVLIYAPLSVSRQTEGEARKFGIKVFPISDGSQIAGPNIYVTNYERHHRFEAIENVVSGIVLDESSILKNCDGKTRNALISQASGIEFRLACTATPAPNDIAEIANHAEFLGVKTRTEMLSHWFVHDSDGWRLKGHASRDFFRWMASWSVFLRSPSDIGEDGSSYVLPELVVSPLIINTEAVPEGLLFQVPGLKGVQGRQLARRATISDRVSACVELVSTSSEAWIVWCGLNDESEAIYRALTRAGISCARVEGNTSDEDKLDRIESFISGSTQVLITKPRVCGFGMNFQHCSQQIFLGLGDSWEAYYQCLRRSYRFGQNRTVRAWIVTTELESEVVENVMAKEIEAKKMGDSIINNMSDIDQAVIDCGVEIAPHHLRTVSGADFTAHNGDCVEVMSEIIPGDSVDLSVYSPPFATLYTYSDNIRDMGNCVDHDQFHKQFRFFIEQIYRVTKPGRITAVHVAQVTSTMAHNGVIGLIDFRGAIIDGYKRAGWIHHGEIAIDKCPQAQAIRTKAKALMFVQKNKDRSWSRPALADFLLLFRKPGDNAVPIVGDVSNEDWIQWARPVWYGIRETNTLNVQEARSDKDERHICPLQLDLIERTVRMWSNPGETVLSPFMGIGSEGFESIKAGRKFIGIELKPEYFRVAVKNLKKAQVHQGQQSLFGELA